jgi:hypothetical protein
LYSRVLPDAVTGTLKAICWISFSNSKSAIFRASLHPDGCASRRHDTHAGGGAFEIHVQKQLTGGASYARLVQSILHLDSRSTAKKQQICREVSRILVLIAVSHWRSFSTFLNRRFTSRVLQTDSVAHLSFKGTPVFMSPEVRR